MLVSALELLVSQVNSLRCKFDPAGSASIANMVVGREVPIEGGKDSLLGERILEMFVEAGVVAKGSPEDNALREDTYKFPTATERDFVLKTKAVRPAVYSAECPQFLRAITSSNECRMAGAFSEDIVFF